MALSIALVCAVLASLAVGILIAYGICLSMFQLFRIHSRQVATKQVASEQGKLKQGALKQSSLQQDSASLASGIHIVGS